MQQLVIKKLLRYRDWLGGFIAERSGAVEAKRSEASMLVVKFS